MCQSWKKLTGSTLSLPNPQVTYILSLNYRILSEAWKFSKHGMVTTQWRIKDFPEVGARGSMSIGVCQNFPKTPKTA